MDDMMYELFGEMERLMNARPDRNVTYRYKIYRRPDLSHPVILRVRDYDSNFPVENRPQSLMR